MFFVSTEKALLIFDLYKSMGGAVVTYDNDVPRARGSVKGTHQGGSHQGPSQRTKGSCATDHKMLAMLRCGEGSVEVHLLTDKYLPF